MHSEGLTGSLLSRRLYVRRYGDRWVDPRSIWKSTQKNLERDWMCGDGQERDDTKVWGPKERDGWW